MAGEKEILEKFILNNPDLEKLDGMLSDFNVFETLNLVHAEIRHSNVLACLLNPNENHGLGKYFLNIFIKWFVSENKTMIDGLNVFDIEMFNYNDVEIRREWKNIDILILLKESQNNVVISIENKIRSLQHSNQLKRYREIVEKEFPLYQKLFILLTPENTIPDDDSWINYNYTTVTELLDNTVNNRKDQLNINILNFIEHYNTILKRYLVGNSEIEKICLQLYSKHKAALDLIFQYKPDIVSDISNLLQELIRKEADLIPDSAGKTVIRFTTKVIDEKIPNISEGWLKSKRLVAYEFYNYDNRLALRLYIGPDDQNYRDKVYYYLSKRKDLFPLTTRPLSKKWHCVCQQEFLKRKDFEEKEFSDLEEIIKVKWNEFLKGSKKEIDQYFEYWTDT